MTVFTALRRSGFPYFPRTIRRALRTSSKKLAEEGYAVIFITEALAELISPEIERFKDSPLPAIIPIPGVAGNTGLGMREVSGYVERAVGSDIVN